MSNHNSTARSTAHLQSPTLGINTNINKMHVTVKQIVEGSQKPRYKGRIGVNNSQVYNVSSSGATIFLVIYFHSMK